jgi:F-type H+-transporting ATPase subunit gamma
LFPVVASTATRELVIVVSSEKWLCGSLNSGLFKQLDAIYADRKDTLDIYTIGKKATEYCAKRGYIVVGSLSLTDNLESKELDALISYIDTAHTSNIYTSMSVMYNYFKNTMKQIPVVFQLFPLSIEKCAEFFSTLDIVLPSTWWDGSKQTDMLLEPTRDAIVAQAYHILMNVLVYGAILHNKTWEFAARMLAMKWAKDNATSMIKSLSLSYNKARQDAITKEVLEIVSAKTVIED